MATDRPRTIFRESPGTLLPPIDRDGSILEREVERPTITRPPHPHTNRVAEPAHRLSARSRTAMYDHGSDQGKQGDRAVMIRVHRGAARPTLLQTWAGGTPTPVTQNKQSHYLPRPPSIFPRPLFKVGAP